MTNLLYVDLKDKQRSLRDGFPMPLKLRVHRALSWLGRAEDEPADGDVRFILLWIGFNAAYAGDVTREVSGERDAFRGFFETLLRFDGTKRIYNMVWQRFPHEIRMLLDRLYVLRNQLVHGGATWNSDVNRAQVRDGAAVLGCLLPIFIDLMMNAPGHDWPMPHYPPVEV